MKAFPIPRRPPRSTVNNQLLRLLRHFRIEVIHQHPQRRLLLPPLAGNLRPPRRAIRPFGQSRLRHCPRHGPGQLRTHEFPSPPLILTPSGGSSRTADLNHISGLDFLEGQNARREVLPEVLQTIGRRLENYNRDSAAGKVMLVAEICIHRNRDIKSSFRQPQKFAVPLPRPARLLNGTAFVAVIHEVFLQRSRRALVNQNSHFSCAMRLSLASSMAAMASSRLTLGYSSKN